MLFKVENEYFCVNYFGRLIRIISRFFLLVILSLWIIPLIAQPISVQPRANISFGDLSNSGHARSVFQLLATNNGISVNAVHLGITYNLEQKITSVSPEQIKIQYQFLHPAMDGNIFFRDFQLDSLLVPDSVKVSVLCQLGDQRQDVSNYWMSFGKGSLMLNIPEKMNKPMLSFKFSLKSISYSEKHYQRILAIAGLINHYYGYMKLMQMLDREVNLRTASLHPLASELFIAEQSLQRLKVFVLQHGFVHRLHLQEKDPLAFEKKFNKSMRMLLRMESLSEQILRGNKPASLDDKEQFCQAYVGISVKALSHAADFQPYIAGSLHEFATLPDSSSFGWLKSMGEYYDRGLASGQYSVLQSVYKYSIDGASLENKRNNFVNALLLLRNARLISSRFPSVKPIAQWQTESEKAVDGMAVSYLKVAQSALQHGNDSMAAWYILKAHNSIISFKDKDIAHPQLYLPAYTHELLQLVGFELQFKHYNQAFKLLRQVGLVIGSKTTEADKAYFAERCKAVLSHHLLRIDELSDIKQPIKAESEIEAASRVYAIIPKGFVSSASMHDELFERASNNFEALLQMANKNFVGQQYEAATDNLMLAKKLINLFPGISLNPWYALAKKNIVPYILGVVQKARMEIWAHRPGNALKIYYQADSLSRYFQVINDPQLQESLVRLRQNIKITTCLNKRNEFKQMMVQAKNKMKAQRIPEAVRLYYNAWQMAKDNRGYVCISSQEADSVKVIYKALTSFSKDYHTFTQALFEKGFSVVLPQFAALDQDYQRLNLQRLNYPYTDLYHFVLNQSSPSWAEEAMRFFLIQKSYHKALHYLKLLHQWDVDAKTIRSFQIQIARGFAEKGILLSKQEAEEPWLDDFRFTYHKLLKHHAD